MARGEYWCIVSTLLDGRRTIRILVAAGSPVDPWGLITPGVPTKRNAWHSQPVQCFTSGSSSSFKFEFFSKLRRHNDWILSIGSSLVFIGKVNLWIIHLVNHWIIIGSFPTVSVLSIIGFQNSPFVAMPPLWLRLAKGSYVVHFLGSCFL